MVPSSSENDTHPANRLPWYYPATRGQPKHLSWYYLKRNGGNLVKSYSVSKRNFIAQIFFAFPAVFTCSAWNYIPHCFFIIVLLAWGDATTCRGRHIFGSNGAYYFFITISGGHYLFSDLSKTYCKCLKWACGTSSIIMLRILKVMGNHVMYERGAWFLRIIPKT